MWHKSEFAALQKLLENKFDSKLEDVLLDDEIDAIKRNGKIAWENIKNRVIVPPHKHSVGYRISIVFNIRYRSKPSLYNGLLLTWTWSAGWKKFKIAYDTNQQTSGLGLVFFA